MATPSTPQSQDRTNALTPSAVELNMNRRAVGANQQLILGINVLGLGQRPAAWQSESLGPTAFIERDYWVGVAREIERGKLDALFLADAPQLSNPSERPAGALEPSVLLSAIAAETESLGLVGTLSTTYNDPEELAARILTLDHVSNGRAGWNIVTTASPAASANFGFESPPARDQRYSRAHDFVSFVEELWYGAGNGRQVRCHGRDWTGRLLMPPSVQGRPGLVQAGGSPEGRRLAGERADAVFSAEMTLASALENYRVVKDHARMIGRDPHAVKVLPGFALVIGSTEREAIDRYEAWEERAPKNYTSDRLAGILGIDISEFDLDRPLPPWVTEIPNDPQNFASSLSFRATTVRLAREHNLTVRELLRVFGGYGHPIIVGTPKRIADTLTDWFLKGAADGFNLMPDILPEGLTVLIDEVLPILRARGIFRSSYEASTFRGRLTPSRRLPLRT